VGKSILLSIQQSALEIYENLAMIVVMAINQFMNLFRTKSVVTVEQLLNALRNRGATSSRELEAHLAISQPTLSRLVAAAGDRVHRMGRARSTQYAATRTLPELGSRLPIFRINEHGGVRHHGILHLLAGGPHWLERAEGPGQLFVGVTPFIWDMSPQGYLGRTFSQRYPELHLPPRITDWNDDHRLIALARRGEDCSGNLILGAESLNRYLAQSPRPVSRTDYPTLIHESLLWAAGSSAAGEQPKFTALLQDRHVLVKFADADTSEAAQRWRDLLVCESVALEVIRAAGISTATAEFFDIQGIRFLEVERFDRVGTRGRRGLLSLAAIDNEHAGRRDNWTSAVLRFAADPDVTIDQQHVRDVRWLDAFGQLIGNEDRHFGNLSFFTEDTGSFDLQLAPVYDMLPMIFAPVGVSLVNIPFHPKPPTADNLDVWADAAHWAVRYWSDVCQRVEISSGFRVLCAQCRDAVDALSQRIAADL
jgi:HipA-like C-terminal domain